MKLLKILLKSKWDFSQIKKKKILLVDGSFNRFTKYYLKKDFNILFRRGEKINIRVLFKCIKDFDISSLNYFKNFISSAKPKVILTGFDYHTIFYKLKNVTNIKTFMLQKGKRTLSDGVFKKLLEIKKKSKEKFYVDHIFLYNKITCKNYKKIVKGNFHIIGSFENNFNKINFLKQKKEILYISDFKIDKNQNLLIRCENDDLVVKYLHKLALKNKINFNILSRCKKYLNYKKNNLEFTFYKNILKKNFKFIKSNNNISSNAIVAKYKYVFCTHSTLGVENLIKGGKTAFIFFKSKNNPTSFYRFGSLEKIPKKGLFWTSGHKVDLNELERVFKFVVNSKENYWKSKAQKICRKIIEYDFENKIFRNLVDKELRLP